MIPASSSGTRAASRNDTTAGFGPLGASGTSRRTSTKPSWRAMVRVRAGGPAEGSTGGCRSPPQLPPTSARTMTSCARTSELEVDEPFARRSEEEGHDDRGAIRDALGERRPRDEAFAAADGRRQDVKDEARQDDERRLAPGAHEDEPGGGQAPERMDRVGERGRAEENPTEHDQMEGDDARDEGGAGTLGRRALPGEEAVPRQEHAVVSAPHDEVPGSAVPEAAEEHRREQVHVGTCGRAAVPPEG